MTPRVRQYVAEAAETHGVATEAILGRSRQHRTSAARGEVMRRLYADGFTTPQIAQWLSRNPSTINYWINGRRGRG